MKISKTRPLTSVTNVRKYSNASAAVNAVTPTGTITDTVTILGIPVEEMTPKVRSAIMQLMEEVDAMRRELAAAQRHISELEQLADQDPLTGMFNRRAFVREMGRMMSFAERYEVPTSVAYLDVNDLKSVNDRYGHMVGDNVIKHVAKVISENIRGSDVAGRMGGDEFAVLLPNATQDAAQHKAAELSRAIYQTPFEIDGQELQIKVAFGAAEFKAGEDASLALASADRAMYENKMRTKSGAPR